jgi:hypothetical protein
MQLIIDPHWATAGGRHKKHGHLSLGQGLCMEGLPSPKKLFFKKNAE